MHDEIFGHFHRKLPYFAAVIYNEEFCLRTVLPGIKVKLILVGSLNCAATYINTLHADSKIDSSADIYEHYLAKYPDCLINPTVLFNCNFVWADADSEGFNTRQDLFRIQVLLCYVALF